MKIDIAMVVTKSILSYAHYSIAPNADYAVRHGYGFHLFTTPSDERDPTWGKLEMAKRLLPDCDWLCVIDADAVFIDVDRSLEEFTKTDGDLLACLNGPNGGRSLNAGAMLLRSSAAMQAFLDTWYRAGEKYARVDYHEQEALNDYFEKVPPEYRSIKVVPFPYDAFNSHWLDHQEGKWKERFVLHMMTVPDGERTRFFEKLFGMRSSLGKSTVANASAAVNGEGATR